MLNSDAKHLRPRIYGLIALLTVLAIALMWMLYWNAPRTCEIRIDCGDLRYSVFGIEVEREPMSEPTRNELIALSKRSATLKPQWRRIPIQVGSNRTCRMCHRFYAQAAAWSKVDPQIAVVVIEDVARYIDETHAKNGLPDSISLLLATTQNDQGQFVVDSSWTNDKVIQSYLMEKGIGPTTPEKRLPRK